MQTLSLMVIENGRRCSVCSPLIAQIHLLSSPLELGKETLLTVKKKKEKEKEKDRLMLIWESISDGSQARTPVVIRKPLKGRSARTLPLDPGWSRKLLAAPAGPGCGADVTVRRR